MARFAGICSFRPARGGGPDDDAALNVEAQRGTSASGERATAFAPELRGFARFAMKPRPDGSAAATDAAKRQRIAAAHATVKQLVVRVRAQAKGAADRGATPEDVANEQNYYLDGWIDSVLGLAPNALPTLARAMEEAFCDARTDAEELVLARLATRLPELATVQGLACVLEAHDREDAVLAATLDAYRRAELPPSPAWESWRQRAKRPGIRRRFRPYGSEPPERLQAARAGRINNKGREE